MGSAIGEVLPLAVALAVSPFAVVTGVVLLLGARGRLRAALFGCGWFAGLLLVATAAFLIVDAAYAGDPDDADQAVDLVTIGLGVLFLALAVLSWRKRPADGERPREAKLLDRLGALSPAAALGLGAAQSVLVIKNVPLAVGAGVAARDAGLTDSEGFVLLAGFAFVASCGVLVPVLVALLGGASAEAKLANLQRWLETNLTTITVAILGLLSVLFLAQGLGG